MRSRYVFVMGLVFMVAIGSVKQSKYNRSDVPKPQDITYIKIETSGSWSRSFKAYHPMETVIAMREGATFSLQLLINHSLAPNPKTVDGYTELNLPLTAEEWDALIEAVAAEDMLNWVPPRWPKGVHMMTDGSYTEFTLGGVGWTCRLVNGFRPLWNLMAEYATKADSLTLRLIRPGHGEYERREELSIQNYLADELYSISVYASKVVPDSSGIVRLTEKLVVFNSPNAEEGNLIRLDKHSTAGWARPGKEAPISYQEWLSLVEIVEQEELLDWLPDTSASLLRSDSIRLGYMLHVKGSGRGASIDRHFANATGITRLHQRMLELARGRIKEENPLLKGAFE